ncbi:MAG: sulfatase [Pirellulaceae bacterium]
MALRGPVRWLGWMTLVAVQTAVAQPPPPPAAPATRPLNVVVLLADDLGWSDLGCYGADVHETPALDRLAEQGVRFTQAYAMSVCSPTRAALLTGQHAARLHLTVWRESSVARDAEASRSQRKLLPPATVWNVARERVTLAESLKRAGYLTFHVGKWHLGDADHSPETHGFDVNIGGTHWGAPHSFFWPFRGEGRFGAEHRYVPGLGLGQPGEYLTDRLTDEAIQLIDVAGNRPFFLNLWFHSPHTPIQGKPEDVARFRPRIEPDSSHRNPDYAAMVYALDQNVGRILRHLDERGLAERTLVMFLSDNGGFIGTDRRSGQQVPVTNNAPLRSGKGSLYEGGIRIPWIVRWPTVARAGARCDDPVVVMDLLPTIVSGTQVSRLVPDGDESAGDGPLDGRDIGPLLAEPSTALPSRDLFFHYPHYYETTTPVSAIRSGAWKLLEYFEDGRRELYNLAEDPTESRDVSREHRQVANDLYGRLAAWRNAVDAQLPSENPRVRLPVR